MVVGAGFAGLTTVRALSGKPVEVVLVDRHNFHTFTPLLYQVASALLDPAEVAHPIRGLVRPLHNLEVRLATARDGGVWACVNAQLFHLDDAGVLKDLDGFPADNSAEPSAIVKGAPPCR